MKKQLYILLCLTFLFTACEKDFEDINKNPYFPTQTDIGPLFNSVIESLRLDWNEQFYLHNDTYYELTQQCAIASRFTEINTSGTEGAWQNYYRALANIRELERRFDAFEGDEESLNNVRAMLKIILAYKTFRMTDQFGDMPYFNAGKGFESTDFLRPTFDKQEDIYKALLDDLKWAAENINTLPDPITDEGTAYISFGDFDTFLKNNPERWIKFANSLRLRHALRMVEKDAAYATPILQDIIENELPIIEEGETVQLMPSELAWRKESTHWSFREHKTLRMGTTMWQELSENDEPDGSGIFDPRAYLFFETNNVGAWRAYPQNADNTTEAIGGVPYQGSRDANYNAKGLSNVFSPINYNLIRDENDVPELILTPAEVHFIKAEAYFRGLGVEQSNSKANAAYTAGVVASISMWQSIATNSERWSEHAPPALSVPEIFAVTNHPRIIIFGSDNQLDLIYKQRWIDAFRQPWEAFCLTRRTKQTPREGEEMDYFRNSYPPSEAENNPDNWSDQVARMGGDNTDIKVWWMQ